MAARKRNPATPHDDAAPERAVDRATAELIATGDLSGTVLNVVDALVVVLDTSGAIVCFNRGCERATGYAAAEAVGRRVWEFLIPETEIEDVKSVFASLRSGDAPSTHTNDWTARDGTPRRIAWSNTVLRGPDEEVRFVVATGIDVTERSRTEASLRDREERLRAVVNTAADAIVTIDRGGIIESFNPAAERLFGYEADEVIGRSVQTLMPSPYRDEHQNYIDNYLRTGVAKIIGIGREVTGQRRDGTTFPMDLAVSEVRHPQLFVGIVRDLTERKRAEEQLRQADRLASIGSLAAGLGHDMNNVLLPMRGRLDALEAADLPHKARQHLRAIRDSVAYLQQLTDGLHLLALDPRDEEASGQATDIALWWDQVGPLLQRSLPRNVRLASSMPTDLPLASVAPHRLTQVALNLLVNAGDAVGEDGRVRIGAEGSEDGQTVRLTVSDNGSGMTPEVRARVFDAFFTTKDRGRGTGLGLALVHGIVSSAGGAIEIDSGPGRGTSVTISLSVASGSAPRAPVDPAGRPLAAVISIEDDRIASMISAFLEDEGFHVSFDAHADPATNALWIASPADTEVSTVQRFLKTPGHLVIACGPGTQAWARLGALVIEDVFDYELVRDRIGEALRLLEPDS